MDDDAVSKVREYWETMANIAADNAYDLNNPYNLHKQWVNRILEPYMWAHGVITSTNWANFYRLRLAEDAQPEFRALAKAMFDAHKASKPRQLLWGEWHLPYVTFDEKRNLESLELISAARCARVSYAPIDGNADISRELERANKLAHSGHMSPFEHQAMAGYAVKASGNFRGGWIQYRDCMELPESVLAYEGIV